MLILGRTPQADPSNYNMLNMKGTKVSQNVSLKSYYCFDELKRYEGDYSTKSGKTVSRPKSPSRSGILPRTETEVKRNENSCDVTFLRKLLAMNKKEELVLNRKLAKLMLEEEFGLRPEENSFTKNLFSNTSNFDSKREQYPKESNETKLTKSNRPPEFIIPKKSNNTTNSHLHTQYDLNGRRIYYDSENYDESEDEDRTSPTVKYTSGSDIENPNPSVKFTAGSSKTYINTTTVIKTKSDITCDSVGRGTMSSRRNSVTWMNQPVVEKKVDRKQEEGTGDESTFKKCLFTKVEASGKGSSRGRREVSSGDGVQNVVVHCCEVAKDKISSDFKKKVLKVWNFNEIPKIKPSKLETLSGKVRGVQQMNPQSQAMSNKDKDMKSGKDERSTQWKTWTTHNLLGSRKSRPNSVC